MAAHSGGTLAWRIPWMEEPGGLQSMGSQRVGHNWATSLSLCFLCFVLGASQASASSARDTGAMGSIPELGRSAGGGHGIPLQYSCLENPMDRGAWRATVHGVAKSQTRLKQLSKTQHVYSLINLLKREKALKKKFFLIEVDLPYCVGFRYIAKWLSYTCINLYLFFSIIVYVRVLSI